MKIVMQITKLLNFILDIIFPQKCYLCEEISETKGICHACWKKINWISEPKCKICGYPFILEIDNVCGKCLQEKPYFDKAISVFEYNDFSKKLIVMFKHYDLTNLMEQIANMMYGVSEQEIKNSHAIIPVPISFYKRIRRKYNQSELIAQKISQLSGIKYEPRILIKQKNTQDQEELSAQKRKRNLIGAFSLNKHAFDKINGKKVVLVDDVFTTGATANECSKILKKNGAVSITLITLARVLIKARS